MILSELRSVVFVIMSCMKVYRIIYIFMVCFLWVSVVFAEPITVLNPSFEYVNGQPVTVKTMGVTPDDWTFASGNDNDGIEGPSSDGEVCVAVGTTDSVYQLLDYTIAAGDEYTPSSPVSNFQIISPFPASRQYTLPS